MSYKALKEYFTNRPPQPSATPKALFLSNYLPSSAAAGEERRPPKTSLKYRIASWGKASSQSVPSALDSEETPKPWIGDGFGRKRSSEELELDAIAEMDEKRTEASSPRLKSGKCGKLHHSADNPSSSRVAIGDEEEEEIQIVRVEEEELVRDSDAGLFARPEPQGPFEPLVLWPRNGEGSSTSPTRVVQVPSSISSRLLEHQRAGVIFLYDQYRQNLGGILADDMGLGKTIQTIAFLAAILSKEPQVEESRGVPISSTKLSVQKQKFSKVVLIICPTSVVQNWEQEFESWGQFQIGIYHGLQREGVLARIQSKEVEIVLTSQDTFRIHGEELCRIDWECVIIDEAHRLKNHKSYFYAMCEKIKTLRRYGLTGTVMQNRYMEMFNVFDWAIPRCLGSREHFSEYYAGPIKQGQRISAPHRFVVIAEDRQKHLNLLMKKFHLRRTKNETIGHLMKGKEDNVVFCPMSAVQKSVYKRVLQSPDYQALINKSLPCTCGSPLTRAECHYRTVPDGPIWAYMHKDDLETGCDLCPYCLVLPCLTKLRQLSNHLELIKPNPKDDEEKQGKDRNFAQMAFGEDADVVGGVHQEHSFMGLSDAQHCGKMSALEKLLASWVTQGDKVLLFSDSVRMLDILGKLLIRKAYCFSRLDGSIPMSIRQTLVEDFNHSPSKQIFLISTRAGGLGLNLTSANRVVIFDPNWNPAHDLQAQDRSFRFGQNRHVTVFRLLAAGSLEELVYTRQIYKQQLFNIALTGVSEKRYFEGVEGSKQHKGELFGMSNLFRDISEDLFAEDIIENHEERLVQMQQKAALEDVPRAEGPLDCSEEDVNHDGDLSDVERIDDHSGAGESQQLTEDQDRNEEEMEIRKQDAIALSNAGVKYTHRNEDVVNLGPCPYKPRRALKNGTSKLQTDWKKK